MASGRMRFLDRRWILEDWTEKETLEASSVGRSGEAPEDFGLGVCTWLLKTWGRKCLTLTETTTGLADCHYPGSSFLFREGWPGNPDWGPQGGWLCAVIPGSSACGLRVFSIRFISAKSQGLGTWGVELKTRKFSLSSFRRELGEICRKIMCKPWVCQQACCVNFPALWEQLWN